MEHEAVHAHVLVVRYADALNQPRLVGKRAEGGHQPAIAVAALAHIVGGGAVDVELWVIKDVHDALGSLGPKVSRSGATTDDGVALLRRLGTPSASSARLSASAAATGLGSAVRLFWATPATATIVAAVIIGVITVAIPLAVTGPQPARRARARVRQRVQAVAAAKLEVEFEIKMRVAVLLVDAAALAHNLFHLCATQGRGRLVGRYRRGAGDLVGGALGRLLGIGIMRNDRGYCSFGEQWVSS